MIKGVGNCVQGHQAAERKRPLIETFNVHRSYNFYRAKGLWPEALKLCLPVIICHTIVLHNLHLHPCLGVSSLPGHIGHGQLTRIALLRVLCLFTQQVPPDLRSGIKDLHQAPVLPTQCHTQRTQQPNVPRLLHQPLLHTKMTSPDTGHSRCAKTTVFRQCFI
jgi:hypothetical protein